MKTIYVVTSGEYSDYGVDGIFDNKKLAQMFIDKFPAKYTSRRIEEMILNPAEKEMRDGYDWWFIRMAHDGTCIEARVNNSSYYLLNSTENFDVKGHMYTEMFAKDEKHAIKIANERRVQHIANNTWRNLPK